MTKNEEPDLPVVPESERRATTYDHVHVSVADQVRGDLVDERGDVRDDLVDERGQVHADLLTEQGRQTDLRKGDRKRLKEERHWDNVMVAALVVPLLMVTLLMIGLLVDAKNDQRLLLDCLTPGPDVPLLVEGGPTPTGHDCFDAEQWREAERTRLAEESRERAVLRIIDNNNNGVPDIDEVLARGGLRRP